MNVLNLRHNPIEIVKIAFVGLGNRGIKTLIRYLQQENVKITALCDIREESVYSAQQILKEKGKDILLSKLLPSVPLPSLTTCIHSFHLCVFPSLPQSILLTCSSQLLLAIYLDNLYVCQHNAL